ncbi:MAG TPA: hypothetical protein VGD02_04655 [Gemmatimonadaceae bacterium]|jgi:hypothetical protein
MNAVDALLAGLVDYAGLFPPASQDMAQAVESYATYLASGEREILGRFILPLARLSEFESIASGYLPIGPESEPWRLSVLVSGDIRGAAQQVLAFNERHESVADSGNAVIEAVELKVERAAEVTAQIADLPAALTTYVEVPLGPAMTDTIRAVAQARGRAKVRTGGVTADAFPPAEQIVEFMSACRRFNVAFKATAGLHHPLRGNYRLTYKHGSAEGSMYGYLNVFLAAALVYRGVPERQALDLLLESDPSAFSFSDAAVEWRGIEIAFDELRTVRENFANSFGSCSFREPVDEIRELTSTTFK